MNANIIYLSLYLYLNLEAAYEIFNVTQSTPKLKIRTNITGTRNNQISSTCSQHAYNLILSILNDRAERHDLKSRRYSFPLFSSLLKKGRRKWESIAKFVILSHAFLLDLFKQCCLITSFVNIYLRKMKLKHLRLQPVHIQKYIDR